MIPICEDQEPEGARACPGYAPGPEPGQGLPQRPDRRAVAGDRCAPASGNTQGGGGGSGSGRAAGSSRRSCTWTGRGAAGGTRPQISWKTVYGYFAAWRDDGTLTRLHDALRAQVRTSAGRNAEPTAAVIDSQSVRAADTVPKASRGWGNAKKVDGRKRHIAVDTSGLLLAVVITAASVQDRDGARPLLWNLHRARTKIVLVWADAGYTASKLAAWATAMKLTIQVVAKRDRHVFEVLPRRWVVERTFAWISKHRRTVRDYEYLPASHEAMITWAMITLMTRRLTQPGDCTMARARSTSSRAMIASSSVGSDSAQKCTMTPANDGYP
jgi:transposase